MSGRNSFPAQLEHGFGDQRWIKLLDQEPQSTFQCSTIASEVAVNGTLPKDVLNLIRSVVTPPPPEVSFSSESDSNTPPPFLRLAFGHQDTLHSQVNSETSPEELFTRRPREESVVFNIRNQLSSLSCTLKNLEELLDLILRPKRYKCWEDNSEVVMSAFAKWPTNLDVLQLCLTCLQCLNSQCIDFNLPKNSVLNILSVMKNKGFVCNENIQRGGATLLRSNNILRKVEDKLELTCLVFNAICRIPFVDDLIMFARDLVWELKPYEMNKIRNYWQYVEMLLDFPHRRNERITVMTSWAALDTVLKLAECDGDWDILLKLNGKEKLLELSGRPEFTDRCQAILQRCCLPQDRLLSNHVPMPSANIMMASSQQTNGERRQQHLTSSAPSEPMFYQGNGWSEGMHSNLFGRAQPQSPNRMPTMKPNDVLLSTTSNTALHEVITIDDDVPTSNTLQSVPYNMPDVEPQFSDDDSHHGSTWQGVSSDPQNSLSPTYPPPPSQLLYLVEDKSTHIEPQSAVECTSFTETRKVTLESGESNRMKGNSNRDKSFQAEKFYYSGESVQSADFTLFSQEGRNHTSNSCTGRIEEPKNCLMNEMQSADITLRSNENFFCTTALKIEEGESTREKYLVKQQSSLKRSSLSVNQMAHKKSKIDECETLKGLSGDEVNSLKDTSPLLNNTTHYGRGALVQFGTVQPKTPVVSIVTRVSSQEESKENKQDEGGSGNPIPSQTECSVRPNAMKKDGCLADAAVKSLKTICILCKEPKSKQSLLKKQLKQIAHCLLQPQHEDLLKCVKNNLCTQHCPYPKPK